jgi:hypothetical protein
MDPETSNTNSPNDSPRCQYRTRTGRRCRRPISDAATGLCSKHLKSRQNYRKEADLSATLLGQLTELSSACDINKVLSSLFLALSQDRIAARRAAVLAYIGNLLLRTLPAMDRETGEGGPPQVIFDMPRPTRD